MKTHEYFYGATIQECMLKASIWQEEHKDYDIIGFLGKCNKPEQWELTIIAEAQDSDKVIYVDFNKGSCSGQVS